MVNYHAGKIYKITGGDLTYIGSTTISLSQRLAQHKKITKENSVKVRGKGFVKRV